MSNNALTSFSFAGNPSTNAAKLKALAHGGPLVVATDHRLHAMMPDAFNDAANAGKTVLMADFEAMFMDAMLIDAEVTKDGVHFVVLPARYKQLLTDVGSTGNMDWSAIQGNMDEVLPLAKERFVPVIKALPAEKRTITAADVIYDGSKDDAQTGT